MTINGVDYSFGRPGGAALEAAGMQFAIRYIGYRGASGGTEHKFLTAPEVTDLHNHGLAIVANFESTQTRVLDGAVAGAADAQDAKADLAALGFPPDCPVYFSVDFDAQPVHQGRIDAYLTAAASVLGRARVGVYGGINLLTRCRQNGTAIWFWQTRAWSGISVARFANIYQYQTGSTGAQPINGAAVDYDRALTAKYGQWDAPGGAGPAQPGGTVSTVTLNQPIVAGTVALKPDPATRWVDLATSALMGPPSVNFGQPEAVAGTLHPPIGTEDQGYQVTINGKASFLLARNVVFSPTPVGDCSAEIAADRAKAHIVYS